MTDADLPTGWKWTTLADLVPGDAPIVYGIVQAGPDVADGVPYVRPTEIRDDDTIDVEALRRTSEEIARKYRRAALREGDSVLAIVGTIGKVALVPNGLDGANLNQSAARIRPPAGMPPAFLKYALKSPQLRAQFAEHEFGVGVRRLNLSHVRDIRLALPPPEEQRRIVDKIDALTERSQRAKEALDAIPPLLERFRQSVLAAAFRGDLTADWRAKNPDVEPADKLLERIRAERRRRWEEDYLAGQRAKGKEPTNDKWKAKYVEPEPVDTEGLPELPDGWCWAAAEELTAPGRPVIYGIIKPGPDTPGGVPYVRISEMRDGSIDVSSLRRCDPARASKFDRATLRGGDILVSKDGTIGKVAIVPPELDGGNITQHVLRVSPSDKLVNRFVARMIEAPGCQAWMTGERKGVGLQGVNVGDFRKMPVPLTAVAEQMAIVERVDQLMSRYHDAATAAKSATDGCTRIVASALASAFRGELVPQHSSEQPASGALARVTSNRHDARR